MTEQIDLSWIKYGLIAVDLTKPIDPNRISIIHFCGYAEPPTDDDKKLLEIELKTDEEFGLTDVDFLIIEAPEELVKHFIEDNTNENI